ncbi:MAG: nucleotidyltransferase [Parcubacteria group bacterium]|jgi:hypothetical protein
MKTQEYLEKVLKLQTLDEKSEEIKALRSERDKVENLLRTHFEDVPISIQYAGSYKKGTMIRESYDLDMTCYFNNGDDSGGATLEEIFSNVQQALASEYHVYPKRSALRLQSKDSENRVDFHIDVIPGRFVDGDKGDVYIFQAEGEKDRLKTNLEKHVNHITGSKLIDTIRLVKLWKELNQLDAKTFIIELLVIKLLEDTTDSNGLDVCFESFLTEVIEKIDNIALEDPANPSGNDLSGILSEGVKAGLKSLAEKILISIENERWKDIFGEVEEADDEEKKRAINEARQSNSVPINPWCVL